MSGPRPARPEFFLALLTTVLWAASTFAAIGVLAFALDREPVMRPVGPAYAFLALAGAGGYLWLLTALAVRATKPWLAMGAAGVGVYLAIVATAFVVDFGLLIEQATSVFVVTAALLAPPTTALAWGLATVRAPRTRD
ncbi:hypothetical protein [uncultured Schumannella sp.]|uniref:hypothetical protein n=1 Tax=uncultured Schumannella sp. TaxID=1195956 RepID=UPI0025E4BFB6|nr:hypothetical protein [uncultured Schumannella sp.]